MLYLFCYMLHLASPRCCMYRWSQFGDLVAAKRVSFRSPVYHAMRPAYARRFLKCTSTSARDRWHGQRSASNGCLLSYSYVHLYWSRPVELSFGAKSRIACYAKVVFVCVTSKEDARCRFTIELQGLTACALWIFQRPQWWLNKNKQ